MHITELTEPPYAIRRREATYHGSAKDPIVAVGNLHETGINRSVHSGRSGRHQKSQMSIDRRNRDRLMVSYAPVDYASLHKFVPETVVVCT
jgi:hypothetical protein